MADSFFKQAIHRWFWPLVLAGLWVWFSFAALGQVAQPDVTVAGALRNLASRSGVAFVGRVVAINRVGGVVEVVFQVEEPLLGAMSATYTLREWAGLWAAGQHRYSVGERVAIFLHTPGKAGLSSPVDGMEGILPVMQVSADAAPLLDVRRLAARVERSVGSPMVDAANGAMALADVAATVADWKQPVGPEPVRRPLPIGFAPVAMGPSEGGNEVLKLPIGIVR